MGLLDFYSTSGCGEFLLIEPNYYFLLFETEPLGGGAIAYKKEEAVGVSLRKCMVLRYVEICIMFVLQLIFVQIKKKNEIITLIVVELLCLLVFPLHTE